MDADFRTIYDKLEKMPKELLLSFIDIYLSEQDVDIPACYSMSAAKILETIIIPGYKAKAEEEFNDPSTADIAELIANDLEEMDEE